LYLYIYNCLRRNIGGLDSRVVLIMELNCNLFVLCDVNKSQGEHERGTLAKVYRSRYSETSLNLLEIRHYVWRRADLGLMGPQAMFGMEGIPV